MTPEQAETIAGNDQVQTAASELLSRLTDAELERILRVLMRERSVMALLEPLGGVSEGEYLVALDEVLAKLVAASICNVMAARAAEGTDEHNRV